MKMGVIFAMLFFALCGCADMVSSFRTTPASAVVGTHVRLMRGLGGAALSPGVDQIGAMAAKINGVTLVKVYDYTDTQQIADEVNAEPSSIKEVIGGYSCGANASPVAASGVRRTINMVAVIQASVWCGGVPLGKNVLAAQETYNPNCAQTAGLGCKLLDLGPGFNPSHFTVIDRPDCHPCADVDPNAQADIIAAIRSVTSPLASAKFSAARGISVPGAIHRITRHNGQSVY